MVWRSNARHEALKRRVKHGRQKGAFFLLLTGLVLCSAVAPQAQAPVFQGSSSGPAARQENTPDTDLQTAFILRPEIKSIDTRMSLFLGQLCGLETGAPGPFSEKMTNGNTTDGLEFGFCLPFPLYASPRASAEALAIRKKLVLLPAMREVAAEQIRKEVLKAKTVLASLLEEQDQAMAQLDQAEQQAETAIQRTRQGAATPYEFERTQIAFAEAKSRYERVHSRVLKSQKALDCAIGKPCVK